MTRKTVFQEKLKTTLCQQRIGGVHTQAAHYPFVYGDAFFLEPAPFFSKASGLCLSSNTLFYSSVNSNVWVTDGETRLVKPGWWNQVGHIFGLLHITEEQLHLIVFT